MRESERGIDMTLGHGWRVTMLAAAAAVLLAPTAAWADWRRAESDRFVVYSDGSERSLNDYVRKLETFDRVLRYLWRAPATDASRKLPIYLVGSRAGLLRVHPASQQNVVGTYFPTEEDIFAVAIRGENDEVLLHEYVHHFMLANMPGAYPGWFVEGFAEYYMTADIDDGRVTLGNYSDNRAGWLLNATWLPLEVLLRSRPGEVTRSSHRDTYYPVAWLLTHWFMSDPARRTQLDAYLTDVGAGGDPVEAMQRATGLSLPELRAELRRYTGRRLTSRIVEGSFPEPQITISRLPSSANDLLLLNQRLKVGVAEDQREATGREAARLAARHADDPLALLAAGHAGLHFGDRSAGEAALKRLLEIDPAHVEALQFLASEHMRQAQGAEDDDARLALQRGARGYLARAYEAEPNHYRTLMLLAELRSGVANYPNENDLLTLGLAFDRAPQLAEVRLNYASALVRADKKSEAIALLEPLANGPHGGGAADAAQRMIEEMKAGEAPPPPEVEDQIESGPTPEEPRYRPPENAEPTAAR
ncbi:lipopolysaccharide assembly protein LapB [Brevundimonas sp. PAMC22021]|uniref:tetratricopeptide repeat protein n=1 Tax=Brevundimonas sp. PAMC22021 TaxID=2861285 RepID=UPI001C6278F0|nr:hypothetical protein [Brevundimonas sp. PAMC22021]QYF86274.1 hypothetical protein KY493_10540 [Brevundimonas sp. PAMC22021]